MPRTYPPLTDIQQKIAAAAKAAARKAADIHLIAVTKNRTVDQIIPLLESGQRYFAENRVQEAAEKWPNLREKYPDITLHYIGQLQSNKAKPAVALFDCLHGLDRLSLADTLKKEMDKQGRPLPCYIQVNTGDESQKGGVTTPELPALLTACQAQHLDIVGLMCIPPADDLPDLHFALLHKLATRHGLPRLSMGMTADFETAIRYGATEIRLGSALF